MIFPRYPFFTTAPYALWVAGEDRIDGILPDRKGKGEFAPLSDLAGHPDPSPVQLDQILSEGQSEPRPPGIGSNGFTAIKFIEHLVDLVRRNAGAGIGHADPDEPLFDLRGDADLAPRRRKLDRVIDQIGQDLVELVPV